MNTSNQDSWKIFQRDTEAGRLLSRLYGCTSCQPKISYPKQRRRIYVGKEQKSNGNASRDWKTTYTVHTLSKLEEDQKMAQRKKNISRANSLKVPKVGRQGGNLIAKVNLIPRRKTETGCRNNVEQVKFLNKMYRPPKAPTFSSEEEKCRLNEVFSSGNSKGLPNDLINLRTKSSKRNDSSVPIPSLVDQIHLEIKERREFQMEMERIGAGDETRKSTIDDIQSRIDQLKKIDTNKAADVVKMLMK